MDPQPRLPRPMGPPPRHLPESAVLILVAIGGEVRHGYAIMAEVGTMTDGRVRLGPGTLYTTIKRLLAEGFIEEVPDRGAEGPAEERRRYYRLTAQGTAILAEELARLEAIVRRGRSLRLADRP